MINQWIANIVGVVVLGTLMDMVIPKGNLKAYTRFFIGLITLMVILQPILSLLGHLPEFERIFWSKTIAAELETINIQSDAIEASQTKYLMELYKSRFEEDIVNRVKKYIPGSNVSALVTLEESNDHDEDIFYVNRIDLTIGYSNPLKIKPIEIAIDSKSDIEKKASPQESENIDYGTLKKHLSDTYEIEESRIYISNE